MALVLMRHTEQSIKIGDNIEIKVLKIQGNQVHLGITAPRSVNVVRTEIDDNRNNNTKRN